VFQPIFGTGSYQTHRSEPNAAVLRQTLTNEGELLSAPKTATQVSADDILVDEEPTSVYAPMNTGTETERRSPPATISPLVRRDSLKRKVPHDGFYEPSKVYLTVTLCTMSKLIEF
jgi:hypothetical protein